MMIKILKKIAIGCMCVFAFFVFVGVLASEQKPKTEAELIAESLQNIEQTQKDIEEKLREEAESKLSGIRQTCKQQAKVLLHDPSSFDPAPYWEWVITEDFSDGVGTYVFNARATNKFGALILTTFECAVKINTDTYQVLSFKEL